MRTVETTLTTTALFSEDNSKRFLLSKMWSPEKPRLAVIMLTASNAAAIELDTSTMLVLNNASRLGFGSVDVLNLFATINDFSLKHAETEDAENLEAIIKSAEKADTIVCAAGVGKAKCIAFKQRQEQVLEALRPFESKLYCLTNEDGKARLQHPLSPAVRTWQLSPLKITELLPNASKEGKADEQKKKPKTKS